MVTNICGALAGLNPQQTRQTQRAILSRIIFQLILAPITLEEQPKTYRDLRLVKIMKIDDAHPAYIHETEIIRKLRKDERGYSTNPTYDSLHGVLITLYSPNALRSNVQATTHNLFTINTIEKQSNPREPCGTGYPYIVPTDILQTILNAHVKDDVT